METINGIKITNPEAAEAYAIEVMGKDAKRRFVDIAYSQWFNKLKAEYSTVNQKIYKLICPEFGHKFSFNAANMAEAESKMKDWCLYHSFPFHGYRVEETTEEKWMHNEYVN